MTRVSAKKFESLPDIRVLIKSKNLLICIGNWSASTVFLDGNGISVWLPLFSNLRPQGGAPFGVCKWERSGNHTVRRIPADRGPLVSSCFSLERSLGQRGAGILQCIICKLERGDGKTTPRLKRVNNPVSNYCFRHESKQYLLNVWP